MNDSSRLEGSCVTLLAVGTGWEAQGFTFLLCGRHRLESSWIRLFFAG